MSVPGGKPGAPSGHREFTLEALGSAQRTDAPSQVWQFTASNLGYIVGFYLWGRARSFQEMIPMLPFLALSAGSLAELVYRIFVGSEP